MASLKAYLTEDIKSLKEILVRALFFALSFFFAVMAVDAYNANATMPLTMGGALSIFFFYLAFRE